MLCCTSFHRTPSSAKTFDRRRYDPAKKARFNRNWLEHTGAVADGYYVRPDTVVDGTAIMETYSFSLQPEKKDINEVVLTHTHTHTRTTKHNLKKQNHMYPTTQIHMNHVTNPLSFITQPHQNTTNL